VSEFNIEGIKCGSCVARIDQALKSAGHSDAVVTLSPPKVKFPSDEVTANALQKIISAAGDYKIAPDDKAMHHLVTEAPIDSNDEKLTPLFVILSYIVGGVLLRAWIANDYSITSLMSNFMGGFFVVFSLFKLLNLPGFADAYATYDLVASKSRTYGLAYPFVELLLGVAYFVGFEPTLTSVITLILMAIGSVGVFRALRTKRKFQCACLGTALKLPMTKVTLIEDLTMGLMALIMIIHQRLV
jgi:copper chaperone CopZ